MSFSFPFSAFEAFSLHPPPFTIVVPDQLLLSGRRQ